MWARAVGLWFVLTALACDAAEEPRCAVGSTRTARAIRIADGGQPAIDQRWRPLPLRVEIRGTLEGRIVERGCTGLRISERRVLTGAHCFRNLEAVGGRIADATLQSDADVCANSFGLADVQVHPSRDVALVTVADLSVGEVGVLAAALPAPGSAAVLAGYGLTESQTTGELRAIDATIVSADANAIVVQGRGGGACVGDSGGPLLLPGTNVSAGVLWRGSATCEGQDEYVPTASLTDWLASIEPAIVTTP